MADDPVPQPDDPDDRLVRDQGASKGPRVSLGRRYLLAALYAYCVTVGAATFAIARSRQAEGLEAEVRQVLLWQATSYGLWIPIGALVWLVLSRLGLGRRTAGWLLLIGMGALLLHALLGAALEARFSLSEDISFAELFADRLPIDLLVYMAIAAALWAAMAHRQSIILHDALAAARRASERTEPRSNFPDLILVSTGIAQAPVKVSSIEWIGAAANYVVVNWDGREGLVRDTLKKFEEGLDPDIFVRAHCSTLVNLAKVASATSLTDGSWRLVMESGAELVASRTYRDRILARLGRR